MRDLKDLKKEEEGPVAKKVPKAAIIGLLGLLVFFALILFFRRGNQDPPPTVAVVTPKPPAQIEPLPTPAPSEGEVSTAAPDPGLKPGEIHFNDKKEEVVSPSPAMAEVKPTEKKATALSKKDDLTFFKTLKGKKEGNVALKPKKEIVKAKQKEPMQTAKLAKTSARPVSMVHSGSSKRYAIQVASFSEKKGADQLAQKLKKKGLDSYVVAGDVPQKGKWYRVRVGSYSNRDEANKAGNRIHESERLNFFVISD
jgi:cell division protein FtsN